MSLGNIHLTDDLVQAVRDQVDIVEVASEHTRLKRSGRRSVGLCPLHKEKTPSFSVDPERGLFYCFGCGQGGDAIRLHMLLSGDDFPAAIATLARRLGIPLPSRPAPRRGGREEPDLEPVLEAAESYFRQRLAASPGARAYLERRQIPTELVERFRLGYAPDDWQGLIDALGARFQPRLLEAAGLVATSEKKPGRRYDSFRHRLMFPIRDASGRLVGFGGRTLGDDRAKYVNSAETARFHKGRLLYGLDLAKRAIRESGRALLVEGYLDVIGAAAAGVEIAVAGMGTALTPEQVRLLKRFADEAVVGFDGDEAGERAYRRALPLLLAEGLGARRARFGAGHDPDSLRLAEGPERVVEAVAEAGDAVELEIERLAPPGVAEQPREQAAAARAVTELLRPIGDGILRYGYARLAAGRLGVPLELLWKRLGGESRSPAAEEERREAPTVRSLEEKAIQLLLSGDLKPPPPAELPPPEIFLKPELRNIYRAFCDLYSSGDGSVPEPRTLLASLGSGSGTVDQIARILLQEPVTPGAEELRESLSRLNRRWRRQRMRELAAEIAMAQRAGDRQRLDSLLKEKLALSRSLHGPAGEA